MQLDAVYDANRPFKEQVHHLTLDYEEATRYAEKVQPYWLSLRHPRDGPMVWESFGYFPAAHNHTALDQLESDGGRDNLH